VINATATDSTGKRIMRSALKLFGRKGYGAVGIREIALEAGVSTAALYHYMRTKEDLLVALMSDRLRRITAAMEVALEDLSEPEGQLVAAVRVHIITHGRFPEGVIDEEVRSLSAQTRPAIVGMRDEYEEHWNRILAAGVDSGVFDIRSPRFARLALLEMCNGVMHWYSPRGDADLPDIADDYADMALALVRASRDGVPLRLGDLDLPPSSHYAAIVSRVYEDLEG
jgi:AcrR family transcriptional regulator